LIIHEFNNIILAKYKWHSPLYIIRDISILCKGEKSIFATIVVSISDLDAKSQIYRIINVMESYNLQFKRKIFIVVSKRIKLLLILGFVYGILPANESFGQRFENGIEFDSIYNKGMSAINSNQSISKQCLEILENHKKELSPIQQAQTNYFRLKVIYADTNAVKALDKRMFAAPDSLGHTDALIYSARKFLEKSMPDKAIHLLMEALDTVEAGTEKADYCRINLTEAYRQKQEYVKGIDILNEILRANRHLSDANRAFAYNRLAAIYNEWGYKISFTDSVFKYSELCIALSEKINDKPSLAASQNELSYQYIRKNQYSKALEYSLQSVANFKQSGLRYNAMNALINQSNIFVGLKQYGPSIQCLEDATNLCSIEENRNLFMRLYLQYATINSLTGNYKDAYDFMAISRDLQVDFFKDRINVQINEQSARYDLLIKEQKIKEARQLNEFHKRQLTFLIIILIFLFIAFVLVFFYLKSKRKEGIKQQLIEAVVETEEKERKRIARDLHDGLGPVLSAVNHYFQAYLDARDEDKENIQIRLQQVISSAIDEVSRISHNISPQVLEYHGLITALNNFIAPLSENGRIKVNFTSDFAERFESKKELTVYRCITELLNNTMKHAEASLVRLDITSKDKVLYVLYSDNGKGFNTSVEQTEGMGLNNIKNRVETFGGKLALESTLKKGIKVNIEIPL
jgi:signal transduction histidine kinase